MAEAWQDIEAIKQLKARYFRLLDTQHWDELQSVFSSEANISFPEIGVSYPSGDAFVTFARETMTGVVSVHAGYMPEISFQDDSTASGIWGMTDDLDAPKGMPHSNGEPVRMRGAGHYHETYAKIDGAWKITSMRLERLRLDLI